jgi:hypothetical protein
MYIFLQNVPTLYKYNNALVQHSFKFLNATPEGVISMDFNGKDLWVQLCQE